MILGFQSIIYFKGGLKLFNKRFKVLYEEGFLFYKTNVYIDLEIEVLYLWIRRLYFGGLTVMLNKSGIPCSKEEFLKSIS